MKTKHIYLEHSSLMNYSRELIELKTPKELNIIVYTSLCVFSFIILALFTFKINNVVKVGGIIKTGENVSEIHNVVSGKITSINYKQNQYVEKGHLLFTIDDSSQKANINMYKKEIENVRKEIRACQILSQYIEDGKEEEIDDTYISSKLTDYKKSVSLYNNQLLYYKQQLDFQNTLPSSLQNQKTLKEIKMQYALYKQQLDKFISDTKSNLVETQKNYALKLNNLEQELLKQELNYETLQIKAPVSGFVQEYSLLNIGDYVFQNQPVLKIIPTDNQNYKIEMYVSSKDIGEITEGMEVKYRLSAFPFFEYRGAEGKIQVIDPDIRSDNNKQFYCVYSNINKTVFKKNNGKEYNIRPGIEVDARIILEKITIASYIFRKLGFCV